MKLALVRACTRSACFELQNNTCYTAPAPFRVQLNGPVPLQKGYRAAFTLKTPATGFSRFWPFLIFRIQPE